MCFSFHKSPSIPACVTKIFANWSKKWIREKKADKREKSGENQHRGYIKERQGD